MSISDGLEMLKNWARTSCPLELNSKDPSSAGKIISERVRVDFVDATRLSLVHGLTGEVRSVPLADAEFDGGEYSLSIRLPAERGFSLTPVLKENEELI